MAIFNMVGGGSDSEYKIEEHTFTFPNSTTKTVSFDTNLKEIFMYDARQTNTNHDGVDDFASVLAQFCGSVSIDDLCVEPFIGSFNGYTVHSSSNFYAGKRTYGVGAGTPIISNGKVKLTCSCKDYNGTYSPGTWKFVFVGK